MAALERIEIGGVRQSVLIRGKDASHPVLIFLHGGPAMPALYLAHSFQRELEKDFVVVHWDRRGAGKSFREGLGTTLTMERLIADTVVLTNLLRERFHHEKVYLVGHSWGTRLGMAVVASHPELFHAYVGIGQLARSAPIGGLQDEFIRGSAEKAGDREAISELERRGPGAREKLIFRFGGALHRFKSFTPLLLTGLASPEYSLRDARNIPRGVSLYAKHFTEDPAYLELADTIRSVMVPVFFFTGRFDYTDPFVLTEQYFEAIKAPEKRLVWFEESAHFPFYEEPEKFAREMRQVMGAGQSGGG
ncbi:alpha/beta hydrolase fold protein [mine drainage metagenome]|uniref:Alpha/beta hydrolase fold protein n=1 Tax=mine drainage metagenome TaxID=410659 RepID=T1C5X3_9ZZZZ